MANQPRPVHVTRAADVTGTNTGQTEGMIRQSAIVDLSPSICGTLMRAQPHSASAVHHHGEQDTVVYAVSGQGRIVSEGGKKKEDLSPGDWALIPAYAEHQEVNDTDTEVVWVIVRAPGGMPVVNNLQSWGESLKGEEEPGVAVDGDGNLDVEGPGYSKGEAGEATLAS